MALQNFPVAVCTSVNSKYVRYLYVMLTSLFSQHKKSDVQVFILHRDLTREDREKLTSLASEYEAQLSFLPVDVDCFPTLPISEKIPLESYFRLLIPDLIPPGVKRLLYLDVDIIVQSPLYDLFRMDLQGKIFAACPDFDLPVLDRVHRRLFHRAEAYPYFNAGVMLWECDRLQGKYSFNHFIKAARDLNGVLPFHDQDILNYAAYDDVLFLDASVYNFNAERYSFRGGPAEAAQAAIIHFAAANPWRLGRKNELYKLWWCFAKATPFYVELLEEQLERVELSSPSFAVKKNWDMVKLYEGFYLLKDCGKVKPYVDQWGPYALYGAGRMAEELWNFLKHEKVENLPMAVMDANLAGQKFHDVPICNDFMWANDCASCKLLITPAGLGSDLLPELRERATENVKVLTIRDFINEIS